MNPSNATFWIGVDVSKATLDIHCPDPSLKLPASIPNASSAISKLTAAIKSAGSGATVILEATGGYENLLLSKLLKEEIEVCRVMPAKVRNFARAAGLLAKTDAIDARLLSEFGAKMNPQAVALADADMTRLRALINYRGRLLEEQRRQLQTLETLVCADVEKLVKKAVRNLEALIEKTEEAVKRLLEENGVIRAAARVLTQTAGVGTRSAAALLASMPELGRISGAQAAALAGLAPYNRDSGSWKGTRRIQGGRAEARRALYMAALVASRHNKILGEFYQRLVKKGKAKKLALTAVMRKLLIHLNSQMKRHLELCGEPV